MFKKRALQLSLILAIIISAFMMMTIGTTAQDMETMTIEVAANGMSFVAQSEPMSEDDLPLHGNPFIIRGYIYSEGTLDGLNGVLEDGGPEFPDLVIGTWICSGFFYGDSLMAESGPYAVTTQIFEFGDTETGETSIMTYGFEMIDIDLAFERAVIGGTGEYAGLSGIQVQTYHGDNPSIGPNFTITLPTN